MDLNSTIDALISYYERYDDVVTQTLVEYLRKAKGMPDDECKRMVVQRAMQLLREYAGNV